MLQFISNYFNQRKNQHLLKNFQHVVERVNALEPQISSLSTLELSQKTNLFKARVLNGEPLNNLLEEAFATVREAAKRILGLRAFDVQIMGACALHNGMIAEMLTGEGKTLVAAIASYLNALEGKGVHIVTVNDYLAKRDAENMGAVFNFLNLTVGCIVSSITDEERREAYKADITYGTNNEFGFDYLRDNMRLRLEETVQRPFNYAIIDEVDSVLIDEARTPLIISGPSVESSQIYKFMKEVAKNFKPEDFELDEKQKSVHITDKGLAKFEKIMPSLGVQFKGSLFDSQNLALYHILNQTLRATYLYKREVDYIVKDNDIVIIDEFTGRMMDGRRFSEGLHQALEAKEGVKVRNENQTLASITLQNYFKLYSKLAGMTGTAATEATEFSEIYNLRVLPIPPNRPVIRKDHQDIVYRSYPEKEKAIVKQVQEFYQAQRPVLIGTVSIEKSVMLSRALRAAKIPHNVLNAKNHEKEAYIVAEAGRLGAVTIATNMAGRGTDIQLGGNADMLAKSMRKKHTTEEEYQNLKTELKQQVAAEKQKVIALGGLAIVATERHETRRIDNQLRGRSGRQGEPGSSVFYISLEDDLMRLFGGSRLDAFLKRLGFKKDEAITHPFISRAIARAQKKVEEYNFHIRKNLLRFDSIISEQRDLIYEQRKEVMRQQLDVHKTINEDIEELTASMVAHHLPEKEFPENWPLERLNHDIERIFHLTLPLKTWALEERQSPTSIKQKIKEAALKHLQGKEEIFNPEEFHMIAHHILLQNIDFAWKLHLADLDYLRSSINLRAYGQKDPFHEYQMEAYALFEDMLANIKESYITSLSHIELAPPAE